MAAGDVRGECERPEADCVAVLEPVVHPHGRVPDDPDPGKGSERQDPVGVVATGGEGIGTRFARPQFGTRRVLEHSQPAGMVGMSSEFKRTLTSLMLKPSFAMLAMIIGAVLGEPPSSTMWPSGPVMRKAATSVAPT